MVSIVYSLEDVAGCAIMDKMRNKRIPKNVQVVELKEMHVSANCENFEDDLYFFASRHRSETGKPCLTVHAPGNWGAAMLGGREKEIGICAPSKMKTVLCELEKRSNELGWEVFQEVTHHGPYLKKPALYVEIGSSEKEWKNSLAAEIVSEAIFKGIKSEQAWKSCFGVGGGHYAPSFTKIMRETDVAVGHILPKYHIDMVELEVFRQGVERSGEKIEQVLLDWKGMVREQRKKIIGFCEELGIEWKRTSEV